MLLCRFDFAGAAFAAARAAAAVLLIFCILVIQFNSFRQTMVVLMTVPLSFVGVVGGMWLCQFPFSLATFIGLVSLAGVVVNDAIVVVDFVNQERRNQPLRAALLKAGANRLRPVLLTTVTTIGGLLPLFLNLSGGAEFWQPLTGAVVSGLAFATVLTLIVIPVLYSLAYNRDFLASDAIGGSFPSRMWRPKLSRLLRRNRAEGT